MLFFILVARDRSRGKLQYQCVRLKAQTKRDSPFTHTTLFWLRRAQKKKEAKTFALYGLHFYSPRSFYTRMRREATARGCRAATPQREHALSHRRPDIISVGAYFRK